MDSRSQKQSITKTYNWCFWTAVGINAAILLACFLILIYIIVMVCIIYIKNSKKSSPPSRTNPAEEDNRAREPSVVFPHGFSDLNATGMILPSVDTNSSSRQSRLPRLPPPNALNPNNSRPSSAALASSYQDRYSFQANSHMAPPPPFVDQAAANANRNSQYVFYTGHGNYHKQPVAVVDPSVPTYEPPPTSFAQPNHLINYAMMMQQNQNTGDAMNSHRNSKDMHAYSNVVDQNVYNEFRFPSYR